MIFVGVSRGRNVILPNTVSVEINQELGVPADDLTVVFDYSEDFPKINRIYAVAADCTDIEKAIEGGDVIFSGIVDEQILDISSTCTRITVYARSLAALLLDNESQAQSYINPSVDVLYLRHLKRFGITVSDKGVKPSEGTLRIYKGYTHYKVIEKFCSDFLSTQVRIDCKGVCHTNALDCDDEVFFDNTNGITFNSISICSSSYSRISRVLVCSDKGLNYDTAVNDEDAQQLGIVRERYVNAGEDSPYYLSDADKLIENGKRDSYTVTVKSDERILNKIGCPVRVNSDVCDTDNLIVSSIHYKAVSGSEQSTVKLIRR